MISQGKGILYAAIAGLLAMLGGITWYASLDNPQLNMAEIELAEIKVTSINNIEGRANLEVSFLIKNPSEKTFTISNIDYELFANGNSIGKAQYSTEDIAMPGRAAFYPGAEIPLSSTLQLIHSNVNPDLYDSIINEEPITFSAKGKMVVESAWSLVEKEFDVSQ